MWIDKLDIYKFTKLHGKTKDTLDLKNHLSNDEMMDSKKLTSLLSELQDAWDCHHDDVQVQVRFVPHGTERGEQ